jgi:hypothetical protein
MGGTVMSKASCGKHVSARSGSYAGPVPPVPLPPAALDGPGGAVQDRRPAGMVRIDQQRVNVAHAARRGRG